MWSGLSSILSVVCVLGWSFMVWRKWRREFEDEEIFKFELICGLCGITGVILGGIVNLAWVGFVSGVGMGVFAGQKVVDAWEMADYCFRWVMWWSIPVGIVLGEWYQVGSAAAVAVLATGVAYYYRRIIWYRSGMPGLAFLSGLFTLAL